MLWLYGPGAKVRTKEGVLATCGQLASGHPRHLSLLSVIRLSFLFAALLFSASSARSQISPGPLAKAHQSLNGTSQCASCHQFGTSTPTFKCLECHKEIARLLSENNGYHARLEMKNPNGKECVRCHLDHNGENFSLIHWEPSKKQFDHRLTGYPLEGKHAGVECEKCHTPAHMLPEIRGLLKRQDAAASFLGASTKCNVCHEDYHKGRFGKDCESCHNVKDWKDAKVNKNFDHSKTRYPLTGLHMQVDCEKCHKPEFPEAVRFRGMKFQNCADCHVDPHHGAFKQKRCEDCHTTEGWKKVQPEFQFDHSKTKYPLVGQHLKVSCVACHAKGEFERPLKFANCTDCHKDIHNGQFAGRPQKGECSECHKVEGWKPSTFGVKEHATSKYPLEGKHAKVECDKCHTPAGKETIYKVKFATCTDCHKDAHGGQFAKAPFENRCESCHTVADWNRTLFTIAKHRQTKFPLTGAHVAVACAECHKVGAAGRKDKIIPFSFDDKTCTGCHEDPHHGEFRDRQERLRPDGTKFGCEACHNTRSWGEVAGFDHSKTKFPLLGVHRSVACNACHKAPPGEKKILFKGTPMVCEACHADVHAKQFARHEGKTDCSTCHNADRWKPSTFDHSKTKFPLDGGHKGVACDKCHSLIKVVDSKPVLFYKPTPLACEACHGPDKKKS
jgi:hypothetical protein